MFLQSYLKVGEFVDLSSSFCPCAEENDNSRRGDSGGAFRFQLSSSILVRKKSDCQAIPNHVPRKYYMSVSSNYNEIVVAVTR